jgi:MFS family permease
MLMYPQSLIPTSRLSLLHHGPFALFWIARVSSTMAFHIQGVGVGWQIYDLTGSAFFLGLVGLTQFLPACFLTLVVGQVVDRYDRRLVALVCQIVEGLAAGALAFSSFSGWQSKESILAIFWWSVQHAPSSCQRCRPWCLDWFLPQISHALSLDLLRQLGPPPSSDRRWADCSMFGVNGSLWDGERTVLL